MEVDLTPAAEGLLRQLADLGPPERIIEMGLELLVADKVAAAKRMTAREAVERIQELRERNTLGGISIKELINEGRKY